MAILTKQPTDMQVTIPQDAELEELVLGEIMSDSALPAAAIQILRPEMFHTEFHRNVFEAICELFEEGASPDILLVSNKLKETRKFAGKGPYDVSVMTNRVGATTNFEHHCRILMQIYLRREILGTGYELVKYGADASSDGFEVMEILQSKMDRISSNMMAGKVIDPSATKNELKGQIDNAMKAEHGITGIPSGFERVDKLTGGWQDQDLIIVAARPGMGKTAWAIQQLHHMAKSGKRVVLFSLEMPARQIMMRLAAQMTDVGLEDILKGRMNQEQYKRVSDAIDSIPDNFIIDDTPALTITQLQAKIRRYAMKGLDLVSVDYLQLMEGPGRSREEIIAGVSRKLKATAKQHNVPIIALAQLSRKVEDRNKSDKMPQLSDLRESGAIEQDADCVIFMYRPEYYGIFQDNNGNSLKGKCKLKWAKHRNGRIATMIQEWKGECVKFVGQVQEETEERGDNGEMEIEDNVGF